LWVCAKRLKGRFRWPEAGNARSGVMRRKSWRCWVNGLTWRNQTRQNAAAGGRGLKHFLVFACENARISGTLRLQLNFPMAVPIPTAHRDAPTRAWLGASENPSAATTVTAEAHPEVRATQRNVERSELKLLMKSPACRARKWRPKRGAACRHFPAEPQAQSRTPRLARKSAARGASDPVRRAKLQSVRRGDHVIGYDEAALDVNRPLFCARDQA